uniref:Meiotic double-stranded break formation protein 1 n=1 Tax=Fundulus heteroclitus TaxID=8078 RepID=A0A3Q2NZ69_FUNHE
MASVDIVYEQVHFRHDPKWSVRLRPAEGGGPLLCVACAIEMMETAEMASVRKCFALSSISGVLKSSAGVLRELFRQDHRVTLHFIATLLGMLQSEEEAATVEKVDQVLVQLLQEFQNELPFHFVLDEVHKQLNSQLSVKRFLPTLNFLGNLLNAVPNVALSLLSQYVPLLDHLFTALVYPDEALRTSVVYAWQQLLQTSGDTGAQYLPVATRDRLCTLFLQTFSNASSAQLIKNCAGMDSLVRSLKEAVQLANLEVPQQGFLLLTEVLNRQPPSIHLFPSGSGFVAVSEAVKAGVSSSCLLVAAQAVKAATALFRVNHQPRPVQYQEVEGLIEAITSRLSELILPSSSHQRSTEEKRMSDSSSQTFRSKGFLLQALVCFQAACRLAEECASEPVLMKNPFTAPYKHGDGENPLGSLCQCLLRCCDSVWIPTVLKTIKGPPSAQMLEPLYSILGSQFVLLPSLMPQFASKLVSSGFYRLAVEHKALLCAGNRNPNLNASCCGFLQKLSMCLLFQSDPPCGSYQDFEEVENLLRCNLSSLCCHLSEWPSLLCEYQEPRAVQYCLVMILYLALKQGDRLLPDQTVFSSVMVLLQSVQEQGNCVLPRSVLRSALYLLAVTQDRSPSLDEAHLNYISKALASCQSFSSLYSHHPALLHFIWRYPELAELFGASVLELWLANKSQTDGRQNTADVQKGDEKRENQTQQQDCETSELLVLLEKNPKVILTLLDMAVRGEAPLAEHVLDVLRTLLLGQREFVADLCTSLRPALLQVLQRISVDNMANGLGQAHAAAAKSLPVVLKLLCLTQTSDPSSPSIYSNMEGVHFKLLYHVSSIGGMLKPTDTESLLPAFNFLQCCLSLSPAHSSDRG